MTSLLAIGCNDYNQLSPLHGAETDASEVHSLLASQDHYRKDFFRLLLSPSAIEVSEALDEVARKLSPGTDLTFYFAGHGIYANGNFYMCLKDTEAAFLSRTALSLSELLSTLTERHVRQAHLIIDACESGGGMYDMGQILKQEVIKGPDSTSFSFFVAAAVDRFAIESEGGGVATRHLLRVLKGDRKVQDSRPFLDLVEVGRVVSSELTELQAEQTPISWALNLYGVSEFAANPHFPPAHTPHPVELAGIRQNTEIAGRLRGRYQNLLKMHESVKERVNTSLLRQELSRIHRILAEDPEQEWSFLLGFANALQSAASENSDFLGEFQVLAVCASQLLSTSGESRIDVVRYLLEEMSTLAKRQRHEFVRLLRSDSDWLLDGGIGNLFYLPIRVSRILGWLSLSLLIDRWCGWLGEDHRSSYLECFDVIQDSYLESLTSVSDAQAVDVYLMAKSSGVLEGLQTSTFLAPYYDSYVSVRGQVAWDDLPSERVLDFLVGRMQEQVDPDLVARPSLLGSAFLLGATTPDLRERVKSLLIALDDLAVGVFLPEDWNHGGRSVIEDGRNVICKVGRDFWSPDEFQRLVRQELAEQDEAWDTMILSAIASYLWPDRLPLFLETVSPLVVIDSGE